MGPDQARRSRRGTRQRIGDLIFQATPEAASCPPSRTCAVAWACAATWTPARRSARRGLSGWPQAKARPSYARTLEQHGRNWLLPVLADVALDRLTGEHCAMVFERIDVFNEEIEAAHEAGASLSCRETSAGGPGTST